MKRHRTCDTQTLTLPIAVAAVLCLCAAGSSHAPQLTRTATIEGRAFATLVTRFADAARQTRPRSIIAAQPRPTSVQSIASNLLCPQDDPLGYARPLRDAILNLPPPVTL